MSWWSSGNGVTKWASATAASITSDSSPCDGVSSNDPHMQQCGTPPSGDADNVTDAAAWLIHLAAAIRAWLILMRATRLCSACLSLVERAKTLRLEFRAVMIIESRFWR